MLDSGSLMLDIPFPFATRLKYRHPVSSIQHPAPYLLQHADPSAGCAQHAPPFSSGVALGVQQAEAELSLGVQQAEAAGSLVFFSSFTLFF
jgi:hypothetical protein